jgi:hypothetical protein
MPKIDQVPMTEFFQGKVCVCGDGGITGFGYTEAAYHVYDGLLNNTYRHTMPAPVTCGKCGLWFDYREDCTRCGIQYYHWFHHVRDMPNVKWCWNCIEERATAYNVFRPGLVKLRPHPDTLQPGYELFVIEVDTARLSKATSRFAEFLKAV